VSRPSVGPVAWFPAPLVLRSPFSAVTTQATSGSPFYIICPHSPAARLHVPLALPTAVANTLVGPPLFASTQRYSVLAEISCAKVDPDVSSTHTPLNPTNPRYPPKALALLLGTSGLCLHPHPTRCRNHNPPVTRAIHLTESTLTSNLLIVRQTGIPGPCAAGFIR